MINLLRNMMESLQKRSYGRNMKKKEKTFEEAPHDWEGDCEICEEERWRKDMTDAFGSIE